MPASYTHFNFGQEVFEVLPKEIKEIISPNIKAYYIGLNGPDIFFYYKPLSSNSINRYGHRLHREAAYEFLNNAKGYIRETKDEVSFAYILGFICHFILDSQCHPYISEAMRRSKISHAEIEAEFDGFLMRRNNLNPRRHSAGEHIADDRVIASHISPFYEKIKDDEIYKCLKSVRFYNKLLLSSNNFKKCFIKGALKIIKGGESFSNMIINDNPNPKCKKINEDLLILKENAIDEAVHNIEKYYYAVKDNNKLSERFNCNFE